MEEAIEGSIRTASHQCNAPPVNGHPLPAKSHSPIGWRTMLDMLTDALNDRPVKARAEYVAKNAAIYGVDLKDMAR